MKGWCVEMNEPFTTRVSALLDVNSGLSGARMTEALGQRR